MKTPDEVPILYLRLNSIRELNTVHIAHICPARPFTGDLEAKLCHQLPLAESTRAVDGSFPVERRQMQPKVHYSIKLQHHIFIDQDHLLLVQSKKRRIPCDYRMHRDYPKSYYSQVSNGCAILPMHRSPSLTFGK